MAGARPLRGRSGASAGGPRCQLTGGQHFARVFGLLWGWGLVGPLSFSLYPLSGLGFAWPSP